MSFGKIYNPKSIRNCEVLQIYKGLLNTNLFFFKSEVYSFINSLLLPYLLGYQIDKPLILLLLRNIKFVCKIKSYWKMCHWDPGKRNDIKLRFSAETWIPDQRRKDPITNAEIILRSIPSIKRLQQLTHSNSWKAYWPNILVQSMYIVLLF